MESSRELLDEQDAKDGGKKIKKAMSKDLLLASSMVNCSTQNNNRIGLDGPENDFNEKIGEGKDDTGRDITLEKEEGEDDCNVVRGSKPPSASGSNKDKSYSGTLIKCYNSKNNLSCMINEEKESQTNTTDKAINFDNCNNSIQLMA